MSRARVSCLLGALLVCGLYAIAPASGMHASRGHPAGELVAAPAVRVERAVLGAPTDGRSLPIAFELAFVGAFVASAAAGRDIAIRRPIAHVPRVVEFLVPRRRGPPVTSSFRSVREPRSFHEQAVARSRAG